MHPSGTQGSYDGLRREGSKGDGAAAPREMNLFKIRYRKTDTVKPAVPVMIPDGGFLCKQAL